MIISMVALLCILVSDDTVECKPMVPQKLVGRNTNTAVGYSAMYQSTIVYEITDEHGHITYTTLAPRISGAYYTNVLSLMKDIAK